VIVACAAGQMGGSSNMGELGHTDEVKRRVKCI
jgi:hypothetical protein